MGHFNGFLNMAKDAALDGARKAVENHDDAIWDEAWEDGIRRATSALYDAGVKDEIIIRMLQRHWRLTEREAQEHLRSEKTVEHPCRALEDYLISAEAFTQEEAIDYIFNNNVPNLLKNEKGLWKLKAQELYRRIEADGT